MGDFNWTAIGLVLDVLGFILVFSFGGFNFGEDLLASRGHKPKNVLKLTGAILVIVGFILQIVGSFS